MTQENPPSWNNYLSERGVIWQGHLFTIGPFFHEPPRLFRLSPGQPPVAPMDDAATALMGALRGRVKAWDETAPAYRDDPIVGETLQGLKALGYIKE